RPGGEHHRRRLRDRRRSDHDAVGVVIKARSPGGFENFSVLRTTVFRRSAFNTGARPRGIHRDLGPRCYNIGMPKFGSGSRLTSMAQEDYLKALHRLSGGDTSVAVSTSDLAEELGVNPGSASEMLGKLATSRLVSHDPYRGARLTPAGLAIAVEMIRHHRLIETYLVQALGYRWDEVHEEADRLEHSISELLEERMWQALGQPRF